MAGGSRSAELLWHTEHVSKVEIDIESPSVADRLALNERLWDRLDDSDKIVSLTEAQKRELDRRIQELDEDPSRCLTWEQVVERVYSRA